MKRIAFNSPNVFTRSGYSPFPRANQMGEIPLDYYNAPSISTAVFNAPSAASLPSTPSPMKKIAIGALVLAGVFWLTKGR